MKWTASQQEAIESINSNIIVSAGAGSGKTAVLAQRVYKHVVMDHYNIDEMLIVTFTNAAAAEMKKRIRKKLIEDTTLTDKEKERQINKIDSSFIMTFDAYALSLVKKYHYLLNVDPTISIIDSTILNLKEEELLNEIFLEHYKKKDPSFEKLIKDFCIKNDDKVRSIVKMTKHKLDMIYDVNSYLNNYHNLHFTDQFVLKCFDEYTLMIKDKIKVIHQNVNTLSEYIDISKLYKNIDDLLQSDTYDSIRENITRIEIGRLNKAGEEASKINAKTKELIKEVETLAHDSKEDLIKCYQDMESGVLCILHLANELTLKLNEFKKQNNLYDFIDVFKMAIEIVDKNKAIQDEVKYYFKEILIDEYQDTNDLQDIFISKIENNNVYMVGDIKQSIYRFRNANPLLFKKKYSDYKNNRNGKAIELTDNFRSRSGVLEAVNNIFSSLMDLEIGGADYLNGHVLNVGQKQYEKNPVKSDKLEIYNYSFNKEEFPFDSLSKELVEAFIIGQDILEKINTHYQVSDFDDKGNMYLRDAKYSDFTILMDRSTSYDDYKKILTYLNIPCAIEQDLKMSQSELSSAIIAFFRLINCVMKEDYGYDFKYSYASLSRNFLVETKDSDLYDEIKKGQYQNSELYSFIKKVCEGIKSKTICDILNEFVEHYDVYLKLNKVQDIKENLIKLDYFYKLAHNLSSMGYDYVMFDQFLNEALNSDNDIRFSAKKENENAVLITNIHKSKGLEYNILYLPTLTRKFNNDDIKSNTVFTKDLGLIIPAMIENKGLKDSFVKELYEYNTKLEDVSEKIRLFYVALTRAKEKIIMLAPLEDKQQDKIVSRNQKLSFNCFKDMLDSIYEDLNEKGYIHDIDLNHYRFDLDYSRNIRDIFNHIEVNNEKILYKNLKSIEPIEISNSSFSKKSGLLSSDTLKKMEFGTKLHYYLETIDLKNPDYSKIDSIYQDKIKAFINCELLKDIQDGKPYTEYEFIYQEDHELKHGFIDLLVEYDDHFDIIDYKLKNIDDENYDKQLNGYRAYIQSIRDKKVNCYLYSIMDSTYREV